MGSATKWQASGPRDDPAAIAVVDDDASVREAMGNLLGALGYSVVTFESAAAFLGSRDLAQTDCLIADVHMPRMSGIELLEQLSCAGLRIPTIFMTGYPQDALRAKALSRGAVDYLSKPVRHDQLIGSLRRALP